VIKHAIAAQPAACDTLLVVSAYGLRSDVAYFNVNGLPVELVFINPDTLPNVQGLFPNAIGASIEDIDMLVGPMNKSIAFLAPGYALSKELHLMLTARNITSIYTIEVPIEGIYSTMVVAGRVVESRLVVRDHKVGNEREAFGFLHFRVGADPVYSIIPHFLQCTHDNLRLRYANWFSPKVYLLFAAIMVALACLLAMAASFVSDHGTFVLKLVLYVAFAICVCDILWSWYNSYRPFVYTTNRIATTASRDSFGKNIHGPYKKLGYEIIEIVSKPSNGRSVRNPVWNYFPNELWFPGMPLGLGIELANAISSVSRADTPGQVVDKGKEQSINSQRISTLTSIMNDINISYFRHLAVYFHSTLELENCKRHVITHAQIRNFADSLTAPRPWKSLSYRRYVFCILLGTILSSVLAISFSRASERLSSAGGFFIGDVNDRAFEWFCLLSLVTTLLPCIIVCFDDMRRYRNKVRAYYARQVELDEVDIPLVKRGTSANNNHNVAYDPFRLRVKAVRVGIVQRIMRWLALVGPDTTLHAVDNTTSVTSSLLGKWFNAVLQTSVTVSPTLVLSKGKPYGVVDMSLDTFGRGISYRTTTEYIPTKGLPSSQKSTDYTYTFLTVDAPYTDNFGVVHKLNMAVPDVKNYDTFANSLVGRYGQNVGHPNGHIRNLYSDFCARLLSYQRGTILNEPFSLFVIWFKHLAGYQVANVLPWFYAEAFGKDAALKADIGARSSDFINSVFVKREHLLAQGLPDSLGIEKLARLIWHVKGHAWSAVYAYAASKIINIVLPPGFRSSSGSDPSELIRWFAGRVCKESPSFATIERARSHASTDFVIDGSIILPLPLEDSPPIRAIILGDDGGVKQKGNICTMAEQDRGSYALGRVPEHSYYLSMWNMIYCTACAVPSGRGPFLCNLPFVMIIKACASTTGLSMYKSVVEQAKAVALTAMNFGWFPVLNKMFKALAHVYASIENSHLGKAAGNDKQSLNRDKQINEKRKAHSEHRPKEALRTQANEDELAEWVWWHYGVTLDVFTTDVEVATRVISELRLTCAIDTSAPEGVSVIGLPSVATFSSIARYVAIDNGLLPQHGQYYSTAYACAERLNDTTHGLQTVHYDNTCAVTGAVDLRGLVPSTDIHNGTAKLRCLMNRVVCDSIDAQALGVIVVYVGGSPGSSLATHQNFKGISPLNMRLLIIDPRPLCSDPISILDSGHVVSIVPSLPEYKSRVAWSSRLFTGELTKEEDEWVRYYLSIGWAFVAISDAFAETSIPMEPTMRLDSLDFMIVHLNNLCVSYKTNWSRVVIKLGGWTGFVPAVDFATMNRLGNLKSRIGTNPAHVDYAAMELFGSSGSEYYAHLVPTSERISLRFVENFVLEPDHTVVTDNDRHENSMITKAIKRYNDVMEELFIKYHVAKFGDLTCKCIVPTRLTGCAAKQRPVYTHRDRIAGPRTEPTVTEEREYGFDVVDCDGNNRPSDKVLLTELSRTNLVSLYNTYFTAPISIAGVKETKRGLLNMELIRKYPLGDRSTEPNVWIREAEYMNEYATGNSGSGTWPLNDSLVVAREYVQNFLTNDKIHTYLRQSDPSGRAPAIYTSMDFASWDSSCTKADHELAVDIDSLIGISGHSLNVNFKEVKEVFQSRVNDPYDHKTKSLYKAFTSDTGKMCGRVALAHMETVTKGKYVASLRGYNSKDCVVDMDGCNASGQINTSFTNTAVNAYTIAFFRMRGLRTRLNGFSNTRAFVGVGPGNQVPGVGVYVGTVPGSSYIGHPPSGLDETTGLPHGTVPMLAVPADDHVYVVGIEGTYRKTATETHVRYRQKAGVLSSCNVVFRTSVGNLSYQCPESHPTGVTTVRYNVTGVLSCYVECIGTLVCELTVDPTTIVGSLTPLRKPVKLVERPGVDSDGKRVVIGIKVTVPKPIAVVPVAVPLAARDMPARALAMLLDNGATDKVHKPVLPSAPPEEASCLDLAQTDISPIAPPPGHADASAPPLSLQQMTMQELIASRNALATETIAVGGSLEGAQRAVVKFLSTEDLHVSFAPDTSVAKHTDLTVLRKHKVDDDIVAESSGVQPVERKSMSKFDPTLEFRASPTLVEEHDVDSDDESITLDDITIAGVNAPHPPVTLVKTLDPVVQSGKKTVLTFADLEANTNEPYLVICRRKSGVTTLCSQRKSLCDVSTTKVGKAMSGRWMAAPAESKVKPDDKIDEYVGAMPGGNGKVTPLPMSRAYFVSVIPSLDKFMSLKRVCIYNPPESVLESCRLNVDKKKSGPIEGVDLAFERLVSTLEDKDLPRIYVVSELERTAVFTRDVKLTSYGLVALFQQSNGKLATRKYESTVDISGTTAAYQLWPMSYLPSYPAPDMRPGCHMRTPGSEFPLFPLSGLTVPTRSYVVYGPQCSGKTTAIKKYRHLFPCADTDQAMRVINGRVPAPAFVDIINVMCTLAGNIFLFTNNIDAFLHANMAGRRLVLNDFNEAMTLANYAKQVRESSRHGCKCSKPSATCKSCVAIKERMAEYAYAREAINAYCTKHETRFASFSDTISALMSETESKNSS